MTSQALVFVSYWLLATEYLRLALKFPLMLCQLKEEEIKVRKRRNLCVLIGLNILFYSEMIVWITVRFIYREKELIYYYILSYVTRLLPALVLIFAICLIKSQIKRLDFKEIVSREMIIRVHTYAFICFILVSLASHITTYLSH